MAAFSGGFTLEAAEQVACAGMQVGEVAPALAELADRSLLAVANRAGGRRCSLLETVRDYALTRLEEAGESAAVRAGHVAWCVRFARGSATTTSPWPNR